MLSADWDYHPSEAVRLMSPEQMRAVGDGKKVFVRFTNDPTGGFPDGYYQATTFTHGK